MGGPETCDYCESEKLFYTFGFATNNVLKRRTDDDLRRIEADAGRPCEPGLPTHYVPPRLVYRQFDDYQAASWNRPHMKACSASTAV